MALNTVNMDDGSTSSSISQRQENKRKGPGATAQDALQKFFDKYPARDQTTRMKKYKKQ